MIERPGIDVPAVERGEATAPEGADPRGMGEDRDLRALGNIWLREAIRHKYAYNFAWLGRPILQLPQDVYAMQEMVWRSRPDLVIETGVAHGGSLVLSASLLALLDYCDAVAAGRPVDPAASRRRVLGVDIEIRPQNREALHAHPLGHLIDLVEGSSTAPAVVERVHAQARAHHTVLVALDSHHTHDHVLAELEAYAPLVSPGSYCVVWDTGIEDLPPGFCADRAWGKGNNPKTAVWAFLDRLKARGHTGPDGRPLEFVIDRSLEDKLGITASPDGFLRRVR